MIKKKRWALLEHLGAPNDPLGKHYDLLLEDELGCRTWRLNELPLVDGNAVEATSLPMHKFKWLEIKKASLSRGRGNIKQVDSGVYEGFLPVELNARISIELKGSHFSAQMNITQNICKIFSI